MRHTLRRWAARLAIGSSCALLGAWLLFQLARSRTVQTFGRLVAHVETSDPLVAVTIDDGPNAARLDEILRTLSAHEARATFFVNGYALARDPESGRRLVAAGHELGNHTWSHDRMVLKSQAFMRRELEETDALIRAAGQTGAIHFRPPFCWKLFGLPWLLWRTERTTVTWDVEPDSYPEVASSPERIRAHVLERVRPGSIVLLHAWGSEPSRAALPTILDGLRGRGYRLVTVSGLLERAARHGRTGVLASRGALAQR